MKDWFFYPIAIALIAGMVAYAMSFSTVQTSDGPLSDVVLMEGRGLQTLFAAEGTAFSIAGDVNNPSAYAVLSAHVSRANAPKSAGVFFTLGPEYEKKFASQNLRITVHARKGRSNPLNTFEFAYFTVGAGDSGWKEFALDNEFQDISFEFTPKLPVGDPGNDFVGIWPDKDGRSRTMDVKWIKVEIVKDNNPTAP